MGLLLFVALNGVLGALAVSLAHAVDWTPIKHSELWNAILIAAAAQGAIRIELPQVAAKPLDGGASLLRRLIDYIIDALNQSSEDAIQDRLDALKDEELIALSLHLYGQQIGSDQTLPDNTKAQMRADLIMWTDGLKGSAHDRSSRGSLENFCLRTIVDRGLRKVKQLEPQG